MYVFSSVASATCSAASAAPTRARAAPVLAAACSALLRAVSASCSETSAGSFAVDLGDAARVARRLVAVGHGLDDLRPGARQVRARLRHRRGVVRVLQRRDHLALLDLRAAVHRERRDPAGDLGRDGGPDPGDDVSVRCHGGGGRPAAAAGRDRRGDEGLDGGGRASAEIEECADEQDDSDADDDQRAAEGAADLGRWVAVDPELGEVVLGCGHGANIGRTPEGCRPAALAFRQGFPASFASSARIVSTAGRSAGSGSDRRAR